MSRCPKFLRYFCLGGFSTVLLLSFVFSLHTFLKISSFAKNLPGIDLISNNEEEENTLKLTILNSNSILSISSPSSPQKQIYASIVSDDFKVVRRINALLTAYSSTEEETWGNPFITASGKRVRWGIVANNKLPFGTKIRIPSLFDDEIFTIKDRMHSRKPDHQIDIWFPTYQQALNFGVRESYIEILEKIEHN